ncbi:MAG TPA: hypothetical protein VKR56_12235 [Candidatus Cybelea sp.]|nr:hypothetical protein [Candidatus Cybelea sp.]
MGTLGRFVLSAGVAAGALAGCGSFQGAVAPNAAPQTTVQLGASSFAGEKFTSTYVSAACLLTPAGPLLRYTATGSATGPLPGTFSASGSVLNDALLKTFSFDETFEVQSGTQTFAGKVKQSHGVIAFGGCRKAAKNDAFKAQRVTYSVDGSRGKSSIDYAKVQLQERFY